MLDSLSRRAGGLVKDERVILGICGKPGAGKSTLAQRLTAVLDPAGSWVARIPMDGFHLADAALELLGRRSRKGAVDTFDAYGYLAMLRRLRYERGHTIFVPDFERDLEQPLAGAIAIDPAVRLIVTEGNYLLLDTEPWPAIRGEMTEVWFVTVDDSLRRSRLIARHVRSGKTERSAQRWVEDVDEPNAVLIAEHASSADLVVDMSDLDRS